MCSGTTAAGASQRFASVTGGTNCARRWRSSRLLPVERQVLDPAGARLQEQVVHELDRSEGRTLEDDPPPAFLVREERRARLVLDPLRLHVPDFVEGGVGVAGPRLQPLGPRRTGRPLSDDPRRGRVIVSDLYVLIFASEGRRKSTGDIFAATGPTLLRSASTVWRARAQLRTRVSAEERAVGARKLASGDSRVYSGLASFSPPDRACCRGGAGRAEVCVMSYRGMTLFLRMMERLFGARTFSLRT
jgi:hypothetical protein